MTDFRIGDILLYPEIGEVLGFKAIAIGQNIVGVPPEYVHAGIWMDGGEASAYMDVGTKVAGKYPYPCEVYRVVNGDLDRGLARIRQLLNRPYGWEGLAWLAFVRRFGGRRWWDCAPTKPFCSQLIAEAGRAGKWFDNPYFPCETAPGDLGKVGLKLIGRWVP